VCHTDLISRTREGLTHISHLEQSFSAYSYINEEPLHTKPIASSQTELESYATSQTSINPFEHARGDNMPNSSESACKTTSLDSPTTQELVIGSQSHQWTDFTAGIPGYLSPYPCGKGFTARDSDRYLAFCGFMILRYRLRSPQLMCLQS
jgi:hypothetical protein